jgi:protein arginine kinase activator
MLVVKVINGQKQQIHLCQVCAAEDPELAGLSGSLGQNVVMGLSNLISGMLGQGMQQGMQHGAAPVIPPVGNIPACDKCGMTLREFQAKGKMGCDRCYDFFGKSLEPLLKRVHGSIVHKGRVPGRVAARIQEQREIERLREALDGAIREEAYEKAAVLRDEIRTLEAAKNRTGSGPATQNPVSDRIRDVENGLDPTKNKDNDNNRDTTGNREDPPEGGDPGTGPEGKGA